VKKFEKNIKREIEIEERISSGTADIIDYFELGDIYLSSGKYNELLYLYSELKSYQLSHLELARVYHEEGEAYLSCGIEEKAWESFTESLQVNSYLY
jgi:tetratricopeptide (TPR) repeat protein